MNRINPVSINTTTSFYNTNKATRKTSEPVFQGGFGKVKNSGSAIKGLSGIFVSISTALGLEKTKDIYLATDGYKEAKEKNPELVKRLSEKTHTWGEDSNFESKNFTPKEIVEICKIYEQDPVRAFKAAKVLENKYEGPARDLTDEQVDYLIKKVQKDIGAVEYFNSPYPQETVALLKSYDNYPEETRYLYENRKKLGNSDEALRGEEIAELAPLYHENPEEVELLLEWTQNPDEIKKQLQL